MGSPRRVTRRDFLRTMTAGLAGASMPQMPKVPGVSIAFSPEALKTIPDHLRSGFRFGADGYVSYVPALDAGDIGRHLLSPQYRATGRPPVFVDPPSFFDEFSQKDADDTLQQLDIAAEGWNVPGNDTDPGTGLGHESYRYNRHTKQWHPHYIQEVRPNTFRDIYLEPGAPVPADTPGLIRPITKMFEDDPLWAESWQAWHDGARQSLVEGRRNFLRHALEDWQNHAANNPEEHSRMMESDPDYRRAYRSAIEEATRLRGSARPGAPAFVDSVRRGPLRKTESLEITGVQPLYGLLHNDSPRSGRDITRLRSRLTAGAPALLAPLLQEQEEQQ